MPKLEKPPGHHTITPGFAVPGAAKVLEFLKNAFGARVVDKFDAPDGSIAHCEVMLGDSVVMFGEASPARGVDPMPASLSYYVDDGPTVDAVYKRAVAAGGKSIMEPRDQFYGYRTATVKDSGGNKWTICAVVEKVTPEEMQRRAAALMGSK